MSDKNLRESAGYRVGEWCVRPAEGEIQRPGKTLRLEPKVMALLVCLLQRPGRVASKDELIREVWPDTFVTDSALFRHVSELRRCLGDDARRPRYVETVPKRGYRVIAHVTPLDDAPAARATAARSAPLHRRDGVNRYAATDRPIAARRRVLRRPGALLIAGVFTITLAVVAWAWQRAPATSPAGLAPGPTVTAAPKHVVDAAANEAYLVAEVFEDRVDCSAYDKAAGLLRQALERDARFTAAFQSLADISLATSVLGCHPTREALAGLRDRLDGALGNGLDFADYHRFGGHLELWGNWNRDAAEREFDAYRRAPGSNADELGHAALLASRGLIEEAAAEARRVLGRDPADAGTNWSVGMLLYFGGDLDAAVEQLRRTLEIFPGFAPARNLLALVYLQRDDPASALRLARQSGGTPAPGLDRFSAVPGYVFAAAGEPQAARQVLQSWERYAAGAWVPPTAMAMLHTGLGDHDAAIDWLRRGLEEGDAWMVLLGVDPTFAALQGDPRFAEILDEIGARLDSAGDRGPAGGDR